MNCRKIKRNLEEYLDCTLSKKIKIAVEDHIRECPDCKKMVKERQQMGKLISSTMKKIILNQEPPERLLKSILEGTPITRPKLLIPLLLKPKFAAMAILPLASFFLFLFILLHRDNQNPLPEYPGEVKVSYLKWTTAHYTRGSSDDWTIKRTYIKTSNGKEGFLTLELSRDLKEKKEEYHDH
jgi:hypothetical protein